MKELNDKRMKAQAQLRLAMHHLPPSPEAEVAIEAADVYMRSVHDIIEDIKENLRMVKGDLS